MLASVADWVVRTVSTLLTARRSERTVTLFEEAGCQLPSLTLALTLTLPGASPVMLKEPYCSVALTVMLTGTVATVGSVVLRLTMRPPGGAGESRWRYEALSARNPAPTLAAVTMLSIAGWETMTRGEVAPMTLRVAAATVIRYWPAAVGRSAVTK